MNRAVISIGVRKTGGLPELQAAVKGAEMFAAWAKEHQGIRHVRLITDTKGKVTRDRVFDAVEKYTQLGFLEQLIVYFSGHGINVGLEERWLLSRAPDDASAAVNVRGSQMNARFSGIGHVVFISDACRTAADSISAQNVTGSEIFPNAKPNGPERPVDLFYATLLGHPSLEVKSAADAAAGYKAAYSDVLLRALRGDIPEVLDDDAAGRVVRAWPLKKHLVTAVPEYLRELGITSRTQQPDARIESDPDAWLSLCPPAPTDDSGGLKRRRRGSVSRSELDADVALPPTAMERDRAEPGGMLADARDALSAALHPDAPVPARSGRRRGLRPRAAEIPSSGGVSVAQATARAITDFGPDHFESQCGIKIRGARVVEAIAAEAAAKIGTRSDVVQIVLGKGKRAANVGLRLEDGSLVIVPVLAGCITGASFDAEGLLEGVFSEPSANSDRWSGYATRATELRRLRAVMMGTSLLGGFRLDDREDLSQVMRHLLAQSTPDVGMMALASHALHDRRERDAIRALDSRVEEALGVRAFDPALLSFALSGSKTSVMRALYPCVPMLTQGWSLLSPLGVSMPGHVSSLRGYLRPSLWTQFTADAIDLVRQAVTDGEVK